MDSLTLSNTLDPSPPPVISAPALPCAVCPSCAQELSPLPDAKTVCPHCGWKGRILVFNPQSVALDFAEHALGEDSTCVHHITKKATAICAGTGDYICALCAVELEGQIYSANYLNNTGKQKAAKAFDRYMERPDNAIITLIACSFIPYLNFIFLPTAFIWIPYAFYLYFKALKMRKTNAIYARVMGRPRVIAIPIFLSLFALLWSAGVILAIVMIVTHRGM